jgi:hypothetical protein
MHQLQKNGNHALKYTFIFFLIQLQATNATVEEVRSQMKESLHGWGQHYS